MLSENCSSSSIYDEVNHKGKFFVGQEIINPKQLWNLKNNWSKTKKRELVDIIFTEMKLEQPKSFIRKVTILPQLYLVFVFTDDCLEGAESWCISSNSVVRCITIFEKHTNYE